MAEHELTDDPALQHDWKREDDGDVDIFAFNPYDPHNGPECRRCGEGFCHHCEQDCYRYVCPAVSLALPRDLAKEDSDA